MYFVWTCEFKVSCDHLSVLPAFICEYAFLILTLNSLFLSAFSFDAVLQGTAAGLPSAVWLKHSSVNRSQQPSFLRPFMPGDYFDKCK